MSTHAFLEFYNDWGKGKSKEPSAILYHHYDGYPEAMFPAINRFLMQAGELVTKPPCYWWDAEKVASIFIAWSIGKYLEPGIRPEDKTIIATKNHEKNGSGWGVPSFQPVLKNDKSASYTYRIIFSTTNSLINKATIECYDYKMKLVKKEVFRYSNDKMSIMVQKAEIKQNAKK